MPNLIRHAQARSLAGMLGGRPDIGVFDATRYGLAHATDDSAATVNTTALQDTIDDMVEWMTSRVCGATLLIPPGRYVHNGGITFPSVNAFPITVQAHGARFRYPNSGTVGENTAMFRTPLPEDADDAELQNDIRNRWRWFGGDFDARSKAGSTIFDWNAASRMVFRDVMIANVTEGIRARFCLHLRIQDSQFGNCLNYGIRVEEDNDWPGGNVSNAAGHGVIVDNCRIYQASGALAGVRVAHTEFTVMNSTFEGLNPVTNIDFENFNTSCLTSSATNLHCENTPTDSHVRVNSLHGFDVDFNYVTSGVRINGVAASIINVGRLGYPPYGPTDTVPAILKSNPDADIRWRFRDGASTFGGAAPLKSSMWVDGVAPDSLGLVFGGGNNDGDLPSLYMGNRRLYVYNGKLYIDDGDGGAATVVGTQT